ICFWIRNGSGLQQIRYRFITNPDGKKLYREEMNATGSIERAENFGGNLIESFKLSDYDGAGKRLKVTVVFCSRLKKNTMFEKVFTMGISAPDEARHWVYDLTG
ncbi:MAG TPA: hypothetical protein PKM25_07405, partial [Candidatus Ozemobacteraceae bacterium]|nr:hypothetical protein [Candidatus Ozemobacteraceae bacterium]